MGRATTDTEWNQLAQSLMFRDERHMYEVMYEQEGRTVSEIADLLKCGPATLNRRMSAYKIKKRPRGGARKPMDKRNALFYMDQRILMAIPNRPLSEYLGLSYSLVYHYKRWKAGGSYVGYNLSAVGRQTSLEGMRS